MTHDPVNTWSGEFGDEYTQRCSPEEFRIRARTRLWSRWLDAFGTREPQTICEVGCNLGLNQRALQRLSDAELFAVEPNDSARETLIKDGVLPRPISAPAGARICPLTTQAWIWCSPTAF
jgi:hypothetical protein